MSETRFQLRLERMLRGQSHAEALDGQDFDDEHLTLVTFSLEGSQFALPVSLIDEVVPSAQIVPIPGAQGWIAGMMPYRTRIVPVLDIRRKLGFAPGKNMHHILICQVNDTLLGLAVDFASNVITIHREDYAGDQTGHSERSIQTIINRNDQAIIVLDFHSLVSAAELSTIASLIEKTEEQHAMAI